MTHFAGPHGWMAMVEFLFLAVVCPSTRAQSQANDALNHAGELEWDGGNIYFDKYSYKLSVQELK